MVSFHLWELIAGGVMCAFIGSGVTTAAMLAGHVIRERKHNVKGIG